MASSVSAVREQAYGEAWHGPKPTGTKSHGTHSTASAAGGGEPVGHNPAHDQKHPNYCPNCGEHLAAVGHTPADEGLTYEPASSPAQAGLPMASSGTHDPHEASEDPAEEAGESTAEESAENLKEMSGSPGFGSRKRGKGTKLKRKGK